MHHTLEIHEILLNIFGHCYSNHTWSERSDLAALARTCRAFKDPALDVLWEELDSLSPLAQCLPEASSLLDQLLGCYSFSRPLTQIEWDILRSYTCRIRSISILGVLYGLDWESIRMLSMPPTADLVLPNLRYLYFGYTYKALSLLVLPLPSLISLEIHLHDLHLFRDSLKMFAKINPNVRILSIHPSHSAGVDMRKLDPSFICQWRNLQIVVCTEINLDLNALVNLSRMPALTRLSFMLSSKLLLQIPPSDPPLLFPNLHHCSLHSTSLDLIPQLLSRIWLPAITNFSASFHRRPSNQDVSLSLRMSNISYAIQELRLVQRFIPGRRRPVPTWTDGHMFALDFGDLQLCMVYSNLRFLNLDIECKIDLTDSELLTLASAWPHLVDFLLNREWGWRTLGGITPNGLRQFLQKCPSLGRIALAIDTRGYTEFHQSPARIGLTMPHVHHIDVLDSFIGAESVPAIAAFFIDIIALYTLKVFSFRAWGSWGMEELPNRVVCKTHWDNVYERIKDEL